jgi:hypothetical protein
MGTGGNVDKKTKETTTQSTIMAPSAGENGVALVPPTFCEPYASVEEAKKTQNELKLLLYFYLKNKYGEEVALLYVSYLMRKNKESLLPKVFKDPSSRLVQGFVNSQTTILQQIALLNKIKLGFPEKCPYLPPNIPIEIPIGNFLSKAELEYPFAFSFANEIPGIIAGGVSDSDAGSDKRQVSGTITLYRKVDVSGKTTGIHLTTHFHFLVVDAIDFCPGDPGTPDEQLVTVPMSRLEKSGELWPNERLAYDLPFEVRYDGPTIEEDLDLKIFKTVYDNNSEAASSVTSNPALQPKSNLKVP